MGTFTVRATLSHPDRRESRLTLDLLVDTGATWSVIPPEVARVLGVEPFETRPVRTADGRRLDLPLTEVRFTIDGRSLTTPCLIGGPGALPLLGAVTLEALGLAPDPVQKILVPVTGLLLCQTSAAWRVQRDVGEAHVAVNELLPTDFLLY